MLRKDSYVLGAALGGALPPLLYFILYVILEAQGFIFTPEFNENMWLFLIALNGLLFRYYMVNLKKDKTGKAIFVVTFIYIFIYLFVYIV